MARGPARAVVTVAASGGFGEALRRSLLLAAQGCGHVLARRVAWGHATCRLSTGSCVFREI